MGKTGAMGAVKEVYERNVLPRVVNLACGTKPIAKSRKRVCAGLSGTVLEIGFGSGHNLPYLSEAVDTLLAVDPSELGQRLAAKRLAAAPVTVEFVGLDAQGIALDDDAADHALSTFTLCTIPDVTAALAEVARIVRPGGTFHFLEHGLAPDTKVEAWQHRLTPIQRRIGGGCHLDRPIDEILVTAGYEITELSTYSIGRPKVASWLYEGVARVP